MKKLLVFLLLLLFSPPIFADNFPIQQHGLSISGSGTLLNDTPVPQIDAGGYSWVTVQLSGTWPGGVVTFEVTNDLLTWAPISLVSSASTGGGASPTATVNGAYSGPKGSFLFFRARLSTAPSSGAVTATASFSPNTSGWQAFSNSCVTPSITGYQLTSGGNPVAGTTTMDITLAPLSVALGANTLQAVTGEVHAFAGGDSALGNLLSGDLETAIGYHACQAVTTGANNTCLGANVGNASPTTGHDNILIGNSNAVQTAAAGTNFALNVGNLLKGDMTNSTSSSRGPLLLQSAATGVNGIEIDETATGVNVPIKAVGTNTDITLNLVPKGAGNTNLLTGRLLGAGVNAYFMDTTNRNTMVGDTLGYSTVSQAGGGANGQGDIALGYHALNAVTTGNKNVALGAFAMVSNDVGASNVAIGHSALQDDKGDFNVAVGMQANFHGTGASNVVVGQNSASNASFTGSSNVVLGRATATTLTSGASNIIIGPSVATTTFASGNSNIFLGTYNGVDAPAAATAHALNIENSVSGTIGLGTNPAICAVGMKCVLGQLRTANFNSTADQAIAINPLTAANNGFLSTATKYIIDEIWVTNCSASLTTAKGGFYTATSKGGTIVGATTTPFTSCTSTTTLQKIQAVTNEDTNTFTAAILYLSLTTAQGGAATGDVYIFGTPIN